MVSRRAPAPEREPTAVKARILTAARSEFAALGLTAGSVRTIGERAGVTAAMVNYYFGGKRGLYDAVVTEAEGRLRERLVAAVAPGAEDPTATVRVRRSQREKEPGVAALLAGAYFDFLAEERELQRILLREVLDQGESMGEVVARHLSPLRPMFQQHFGKGEEAMHLAVSLFGAVAGWFLYEPVLASFFGADPRSRKLRERRRQHVVQLAQTFEEMPR